MNKREITISQRVIGSEQPPLVIAEIGINHSGCLETAFELVDSAIASGAEMIKHQTHVVEDEMIQAAKQIVPGNADKSIYDIMSQCALSQADEIKLKQYVESRGAIFISTPFSRAAADRLEAMQVPAYKIGSGECNNYPLIEHVARFGKPMIISTGMNTIDSVQKTVEIVRAHRVPYALLHCTNVYPTPAHLVRLGAMTHLADAFEDAVIGLSDHTTSNLACLAATAMGASILERHYTDRMDRKGPDICCSMDSLALRELILGSSEIAKMRGGEKQPVVEEKPTIDFAFATVVSIEDIQPGEAFTEENIWVKRPGTGKIPAALFGEVVGKKSNARIRAGEHIDPDHILNFKVAD